MKEIPFSSFYQAYQKEHTLLMYASRRNMMPFHTWAGVRLLPLYELADR